MAKRASSDVGIELAPDAWSRFQRAMAVVVKSPPQHRIKSKTKRKDKKARKGKKCGPDLR